MKRTLSSLLAVCALCAVSLTSAASGPFDSHSDPERELLYAEMQAKKEHKNILLDFGGNWCPPCIEIDRMLTEDTQLALRIDRHFVVVHVSIGAFKTSKQVTAFRSRYPEFKGVPHIFVLAPDGTLLHDQVMNDLVSDTKKNSFSYKKLEEFLDRWAPPRSASEP